MTPLMSLCTFTVLSICHLVSLMNHKHAVPGKTHLHEQQTGLSAEGASALN